MNKYVKNLSRIEFIITEACTGRCKHCSEGDHVNCKGHNGDVLNGNVHQHSILEILENYKP